MAADHVSMGKHFIDDVWMSQHPAAHHEKPGLQVIVMENLQDGRRVGQRAIIKGQDRLWFLGWRHVPAKLIPGAPFEKIVFENEPLL